MNRQPHQFDEKLHDNSEADNFIGWFCCVVLVLALILNSAGYLGGN